MNVLRWCLRALVIGLVCGLLPQSGWAGTPPAQKVPSALLAFPFIEFDGDHDTRIEVVNLSGQAETLQCFYVQGDSLCSEIGFVVYLTAYQPMAWLASSGLNDVLTGSAIPPFFGDGEMKCAVVPDMPNVELYNAIQGRATVFGSAGDTVSYGAVGFQRLTDGDFTGLVPLDGTTYAQCPDRLHFDIFADQPASTSDIILVTCSEDLLTQIPTTVVVQLLVTSELEQSFSASMGITCFDRQTLSDISGAFTRSLLGTDTAHVAVRGVNGPLIGLVIDGVPSARTAGNEPAFQGGRSATVMFPTLVSP